MAKSEKDFDWKAERKKIIPVFLVQVVLAAVLTFVILYGGYHYCGCIPVPKSNEFTEKLVYTARICAFPAGLIIFIAMYMVANKRSNSAAFNPMSGNEDCVKFLNRFLMNTIEQSIIFLLLAIVLITYLEPPEMRLVALYAFVFVVSRIMFRIGYGIHPKYRSCGFLLFTFTNMIIIGVILYMMYTRGFMYNVATTTFGDQDIPASASEEKNEL